MSKIHLISAMAFVLISMSFVARDQLPRDYRSFKENNLYGFKDHQGQVFIQPQYEYAFDFVDGIAIVKSGGFFGYINMSNTPISAFEFDKCANFEKGTANVMKNGKTGRINTSGTIIIQPEYDDIKPLDDTHFACYLNNNVALHNGQNVITPFKYDGIQSMNSGAFYFVLNEKYGVLGKNGAEIGDVRFYDIPYCYQDVWKEDTTYYIMGRVEKNQLYSYMSMAGEVFIDGKEYSTQNHLPKPFMVCERESETKVVNVHTGKTVIEATTAPYVDVDWLTCVEFDEAYQPVPFILFGVEGNYELHSLENQKFVLKNLLKIPQITEEYIIAQTTESYSNMYSREGKLLIKDAQIRVFPQMRDQTPHRVCPIDPEYILILKNGKAATGSLKEGKLKFKKKGDWAYLATKSSYSKSFSGFELVYDNSDTLVFALWEDEFEYYFAYVPGKKPVYIFKESENNSVQIVSVSIGINYDEYDEGSPMTYNVCTLNVAIDGKLEKREALIYE